MIFDWLFKPHNFKLSEPKPMWEYSEKPIYKKEYRETMEIMADILKKLDEIKILVDEVKDKKDGK